jgi:hypothetical protein
MLRLKPVLLSGLLASIAGCSIVPEKKVYTEIEIAAKPETIWSILTDNHKYPEWNPYHVMVKGKLETGKKLEVRIHKPNGAMVKIEPHVLRLERNRELTWGGGIRGIFTGKHVFQLERIDAWTTRLIHKETFSGFAVPFASLEAIEEGYRKMNLALKKRAEAMDAKI